MRLNGRIAIITGAARGIGAAFAATHVREGATVSIADIDLVRAGQTAKATAISPAQSAGLDFIKHDINVSAIAPGVVDGEHWEGVDALFAKYENLPLGEKKRQVAAGVPYGRLGAPEDLAGMAVFGIGRKQLYRCPDIQCRRRAMDELRERKCIWKN